MHVVIQVLPALERPPASCVWPALCWEPRWRTPCWSWTPPTTGEAPLRTTSGCLVDWELTVSFLSAGASTWWGTRSRCLLSRRSHCPKDGTRSSFWTKPTGKQAVQWLFKNKEIPILRLKLQGNMKYEGAASSALVGHVHTELLSLGPRLCESSRKHALLPRKPQNESSFSSTALHTTAKVNCSLKKHKKPTNLSAEVLRS